MAGLGRRTFQAGEVLTASNVMAYLQDQVVQNYAGTAARGSAIGTAVSEGMVSYLADTNVVQAYDGSAWNSLAYASAVPSTNSIGLVSMIPTSTASNAGTVTTSATGEVTFSGVTTVSLNGVFTSSYKNYRVVFAQTGTATTANVGMVARLRTAGTDLSSNSYYWGGMYGVATNASGNWYSGGSPFIRLNYLANAAYGGFSLDLYTPQMSNRTNFSAVTAGQSSTSIFSTFMGGTIDLTNQFDGFTLTVESGSGSFNGVLKVYGYN